ncbi:MAG: DUF6125 family protein [Candidatus Bathyarchaeia archaeon]
MELAKSSDKDMLSQLSKEKLVELLLLHVRNLWRVDGLYFLGIEEKFGTEAATQIDANCWRLMGKLEARELRETLQVKDNSIASLMYLLRNTSWAIYQAGKEIEIASGKAVFRVTDCRVQQARIRKGLGEFPCKQVRYGYLKSFAEEFNPNVKVNCKICPPNPHPPNTWCEWEFSL